MRAIEDQASCLRSLFEDLEKQIEVAKLHRVKRPIKWKSWAVGCYFGPSEDAKQELAQKQQETLACASTKTDRRIVSNKKMEKELATMKKILGTSHWASTRAVCRALADGGWKSNERIAIESRSSVPQESSHRQGFDRKAQTNFETAKRKEVRHSASWISTSDGQGLLAEYQEQLVKVEQAKAAYQEAQTAMFDLMDEIKK